MGTLSPWVDFNNRDVNAGGRHRSYVSLSKRVGRSEN